MTEITSVPVVAEADVSNAVRDGALVRFEVFLFCSIGTVLVNRAFLAATGYPKLGSGGLHIAHVLWGGLLLAVAVVMMLAGIGTRIRVWAALIGGIGFGLFIDEVGKFVTRDVNYFYKPAVAIMYVVFVLSYLIVRYLLMRRRLSDPIRVALAATAVADQALGDLDAESRAGAVRLVDTVATPTEVTASIRVALLSERVAESAPFGSATNAGERIRRAFERVVGSRVVQAAAFVVMVYGAWFRLHEYIVYLQVTLDLHISLSFYFTYLLVTNLVGAGIVALGLLIVLIPRMRLLGLRVLHLGLLFDLLFDQFSTFKFSQFRALTGFAVELLLLLAVRTLIGQSRRIRLDARTPTNRAAPADGGPHLIAGPGGPPGAGRRGS